MTDILSRESGSRTGSRLGHITTRRSLVAAILIVLAALPAVSDAFTVVTATQVLVLGLLAASLTVLTGTVGLPSLGHAAFYGLGGYTAALLAIHLTAAAPLLLIAAFLVSALIAAVGGLVVVRSHGAYLLMLTLALGEVLRHLITAADDVTGGTNGLAGVPSTRVGGFDLSATAFVYWYVLGITIVGAIVIAVVVHSRWGRILRGIRDNEQRMRALGYATTGHRLAIFALCSGIAGVAGSLQVTATRFATPESMGLMTSALALIMVVIGGVHRWWGAFLGALVIVAIRDLLSPALLDRGTMLLGLVLVLVVLFAPRGLAGLTRTRRARPVEEASG